jgi:hypothetical protein
VTGLERIDDPGAVNHRSGLLMNVIDSDERNHPKNSENQNRFHLDVSTDLENVSPWVKLENVPSEKEATVTTFGFVFVFDSFCELEVVC